MPLSGYRHVNEENIFGFDQFGNTVVQIIDPASTAGTQKTIINQFMDTTGDGTGTKIATGNYSDAGDGLTSFKIAPGAGEIYRLSRLIVHIADEGVINTAATYGQLTLTNGVAMSAQTVNNPGGVDPLMGINIFSTWDWGRYCFDVLGTDYTTNLNIFQARWTFQKAGQFVRLDGDAGDFLSVDLNDNFSGLNDHTFIIQGYIE